jgi:hypothetical protein
VEQLKTVNLPRYSVALRQNDSPVLQANGSARYILDTKDTTAQVTVDGVLPRLLRWRRCRMRRPQAAR